MQLHPLLLADKWYKHLNWLKLCWMRWVSKEARGQCFWGFYQKSFKSETTQNKVQRNVSICHINGTQYQAILYQSLKIVKAILFFHICLKFQWCNGKCYHMIKYFIKTLQSKTSSLLWNHRLDSVRIHLVNKIAKLFLHIPFSLPNTQGLRRSLQHKLLQISE